MSTPLIFQPLKKYIDFNGRARRSEFWLWVLFRILVGMVMGGALIAVMFPTFATMETDPVPFFSRYFIVIAVYILIEYALLLPTIAVAVRRLHDSNRSGWWLVMPQVVGIVVTCIMLILLGLNFHVFTTFEAMESPEEIMAVLIPFFSVFCLLMLPCFIAELVLLVFYLLPGTKGANKYGENPRN